MSRPDFNLRTLYEALDEQRRARSMSWADVAREVSRFSSVLRPVTSSTITGIKDKAVAEGDGVLQMILWLRRTPESFIPDFKDADAQRFRLREVGPDRILRWDTKGLYAALNVHRQMQGLTWTGVAREMGGVTASVLTNLSKGGRASLPSVMRIIGWLDEPATKFTRASPH